MPSNTTALLEIKAVDKSKQAFNSVKNNLSKVENATGKFKSKLASLKPDFQQMAAVGAVALGGIGLALNKTIGLASDFEEATNKFGVVFGDVSVEAEAMAKTLNDSYGLSKLASIELLSATGDLLSGFGFSGAAALDLSSRVQTMSVDLASFTNAQGGAEAVSNALTKALLGETESLKTYGIAIRQADVEMELMAMGLDNLTGQALMQAKAEATMQIALRQSKNAIGDYGRSAGSLVQAKVELTKTIEDAGVVIGNIFLPALTSILTATKPIVDKISEWVEKNPELIKTIAISTIAVFGLSAAIGAVGLALSSAILPYVLVGAAITAAVVLIENQTGAFSKLKDFIVQNVIPALQGLWAFVQENLIPALMIMWEVFKEFVTPEIERLWHKIQNELMPELKELWATIKTELIPVLQKWTPLLKIVAVVLGGVLLAALIIVTNALTKITGVITVILQAFTALATYLTQGFGFAADNISNKINNISNAFKSLWGWIQKVIDKWNSFKAVSGGGIGGAIGGVAGAFNVPFFADGGIVTKPTLAMVGEGGESEAIIPLSKLAGMGGGGGGITVNITGNSFMGEADMAEQVGNQLVGILKNNQRL